MVIITDRVTQIYLNSILILANYKLPFFPIVLLRRCVEPSSETHFLIYFAVVIYYPRVFAISFSTLNGVSVFPCN